MFKNTETTNQLGNIGLSFAIAYYSKLGYFVSVPLTDSQDYDLVVDNKEKLLKVQVKTVIHRSDNGNFEVNLATKGRSTTKKFDENNCDLLFVLTEDGTCYSIPRNEITATKALTLGSKYSGFKVSLFE